MSVNGSSEYPSILDVENLQMTNAFHSKTRSLPYETLSYIFQHTCPALDVFEESVCDNFHLDLRLVSSLWYQVVQSTPQLWTSFYFVDTTAESTKEHIKICIENSGELNLHILFRSKSCRFPDGEWVYEILESILHRIESLRVLDDFISIPEWFDALLPEMCRLRLVWLPDADTFPEGTTTLEKMRLGRSYYLGANDIPPGTTLVTHLYLSCVKADFCIQFLIQCPNLSEFHCFYLTEVSTGSRVPTSTIVLNKLSSFTWSTPCPSDSQFHEMLFEHLHLPALEEFHLVNSGELEFNKHTVAFFSRLPKSLEKLKFERMEEWIGQRLLRSLDKDIEIRSIHILRCSLLFLFEIFSCLSETTGEGSRFPLPHLTCFHLRLNAIVSVQNPDPPAWIEERLALMLQERVGMMDTFTFSMDSRHWLARNDASWRIFKELKQGGLDLTLIGLKRVVNLEAPYVESMKEWTSYD